MPAANAGARPVKRALGDFFYNILPKSERNYICSFGVRLALLDGETPQMRLSARATTAEKENLNYYVERSLYIEDTLYTVSNVKVKMNDL